MFYFHDTEYIFLFINCYVSIAIEYIRKGIACVFILKILITYEKNAAFRLSSIQLEVKIIIYKSLLILEIQK